MHEIGLYLDETMASGIAAQNQLFNSLSNLLNEHAAEHPEDKQAADAAAQTVLAMRRPLYTERDRIRSLSPRIMPGSFADMASMTMYINPWRKWAGSIICLRPERRERRMRLLGN